MDDKKQRQCASLAKAVMDCAANNYMTRYQWRI